MTTPVDDSDDGAFIDDNIGGVTFTVSWNVKGYSGQTEVQLMGRDQMKQMV